MQNQDEKWCLLDDGAGREYDMKIIFNSGHSGTQVGYTCLGSGHVVGSDGGVNNEFGSRCDCPDAIRKHSPQRYHFYVKADRRKAERREGDSNPPGPEAMDWREDGFRDFLSYAGGLGKETYPMYRVYTLRDLWFGEFCLNKDRKDMIELGSFATPKAAKARCAEHKKARAADSDKPPQLVWEGRDDNKMSAEAIGLDGLFFTASGNSVSWNSYITEDANLGRHQIKQETISMANAQSQCQEFYEFLLRNLNQ